MNVHEALIKRIFDGLAKIDKDGDGTVSFLELKQALRDNPEFALLVGHNIHTKLSENDVEVISKQIAAFLDKDGDGEITWKEFNDWALSALKTGGQQKACDSPVPVGAVVVNVDGANVPCEAPVRAAVPAAPAGSLWVGLLRDTVRSACGLLAAEVWLAQPDGTMRRVDGGYYNDPLSGAADLLSQDPGPASPGVGLAGLAMAKASSVADAPADGAAAEAPRARGRRMSLRSAGIAALAVSSTGPGGPVRGEPATADTSSPLEWTLLQQLARDEDTPDDARTTAAAEVFGYVAAAPFSGGLLLLFSRRDTTVAQLGQPAQIAFLAAQAQVCAALATVAPARAAIMAKKGGNRHWRKLRLLLKTGMLGRAIQLQREREARGEKMVAVQAEKREFLPKTRAWLANYVRKFRGVPGATPPKMGALGKRAAWEVPAWTWFGVACTLLVLSALNEWITQLTDGEYFLIIGSFGALMALQFGAPNSPLAQPRNVIFSNLVAAAIAVAFYYLSGPEFLGVIPQWVAVALAPATAIAVNQRLGVLHPPAGAASLIFVSAGQRITDLGWMYLIMPLLVGNLVCCCMAALVNNLCKTRQYPVFF